MGLLAGTEKSRTLPSSKNRTWNRQPHANGVWPSTSLMKKLNTLKQTLSSTVWLVNSYEGHYLSVCTCIPLLSFPVRASKKDILSRERKQGMTTWQSLNGIACTIPEETKYQSHKPPVAPIRYLGNPCLLSVLSQAQAYQKLDVVQRWKRNIFQQSWKLNIFQQSCLLFN